MSAHDLALTRVSDESDADAALAVTRLSDGELLRRMRTGDDAALGVLYDRYAGLIVTVALRVVGERAVAEEILQDTFLRAWNAADTFQPSRGQVSGWLIGIARNRSIDVLRSRMHHARQRERDPLPEHAEGAAWGVPDQTDEIATRQVVSAAMQSLPIAQRRVLELAYWGGMSQTEIARELGEPLGTVKSRARSGMEQLRRALRPHFRTDLHLHDMLEEADAGGAA